MGTDNKRIKTGKMIVWTEPWYVDAHNNIRYTNLVPRLKLVKSLIQFQKKHTIHGKAIRKLKKKFPTIKKIFNRIEKHRFQKLSMLYRVLLVTSDHLQQIDYFNGYVIVDDDDPEFTSAHMHYLNNDKVLAVVTTTQQLKNNLIKHGLKKQCFVIPSGVDLKMIQKIAPDVSHKENDSDIVCGYVMPYFYLDEGTAEDTKLSHKERSISYLLKAMEIVWKRKKNVKLWLVGKPSRSVELYAKKQPNIRLWGYIPHSQIFSIMKSFDIAIFAKTVDFGGRHHIKLLEYMACGLPIVAVNTSESAPVLEANSGIVASTPEEFAEAIIELANNPALREQLGKNGLEYVKEFDWDVIARRYENEVLLPVLNKITLSHSFQP